MRIKKFLITIFFISLFLVSEISVVNAADIDTIDLKEDFVTTSVVDVPAHITVNKAQVIYLVPSDTKLKVIDSTDEFYEVEYKNVPGWILKRYTLEGSALSVDNFINYKQFGQSWSSIPYSEGNIGTSGCGPTSAAICVSGLGCKLNPGDIVKKLGYNLTASIWANRTLLSNIGYNLSDDVGRDGALAQLASGNPIICAADPGFYTKYGHFMALIGVRGNEVYLSDPNSYSETRNGWIDIDLLIDRGVHKFLVVTKK